MRIHIMLSYDMIGCPCNLFLIKLQIHAPLPAYLFICSSNALFEFITCFCCSSRTFSHTLLPCYFSCFFWVCSGLSWFCYLFTHFSSYCCRFMCFFLCWSHGFFFSIFC